MTVQETAREISKDVVNVMTLVMTLPSSHHAIAPCLSVCLSVSSERDDSSGGHAQRNTRDGRPAGNTPHETRVLRHWARPVLSLGVATSVESWKGKISLELWSHDEC